MILNAGVMAIPLRKTHDDFEMQMATNHLGHFAFAGLLRNRVKSRVVTISSKRTGLAILATVASTRFKISVLGAISTRLGELMEQVNWQIFFSLLNSSDCQLRGIGALALLQHIQVTQIQNLQGVAPKMKGSIWEERGTAFANAVIAQSASRGALPTLCAAVFQTSMAHPLLDQMVFLKCAVIPKRSGARSIAYDQDLAGNLWK